jgi:signal peptidase II
MDITRSPWRALFLGIVLLVCVGCDQATKHFAQRHLKGAAPLSYWGDTFRIQYAENPGAFLSLAANLPAAARFWLLTVINGVVLGAVGLYLALKRDLDGLSLAALALILAGGIGNLIDRVTLGGIVVDFLNVGIGGLRTGVFNIADMAITGGFLLLFPSLFQREPGCAGNAAASAPAPLEN